MGRKFGGLFPHPVEPWFVKMEFIRTHTHARTQHLSLLAARGSRLAARSLLARCSPAARPLLLAAPRCSSLLTPSLDPSLLPLRAAGGVDQFGSSGVWQIDLTSRRVRAAGGVDQVRSFLLWNDRTSRRVRRAAISHKPESQVVHKFDRASRTVRAASGIDQSGSFRV